MIHIVNKHINPTDYFFPYIEQLVALVLQNDAESSTDYDLLYE